MTTIAYLDCPSGVSGDMLLGALLDAGVALDELRALLGGLPLEGYTLEAALVVRGALGATHARVVPTREEHAHRYLGDVLAIIEHGDLPERVKRDAGAVFRRLATAEARVHRVGIDEVHFHEVGAVDAIVDVVGVCAGLHLLGVEEVYCSPLPLGRGQTTMAHGTLPLPAPAVLELLAMSGAPTVPHTATTELVTPTGAALVTTLARFAQPPLRLARVGYGAGTRAEPAPNLLRLWLGERYIAPSAPASTESASPPATVSTGSASVSPLAVQPTNISTGSAALPPGNVSTGSAGFQPANVGMQDAEDSEPLDPDGGRLDSQRTGAGALGGPKDGEGLTVEQLLVLEANIDDMPAELFGYAMERLLAAGALDAWCAPLTMKKARPGALLGALCRPADRAALVGVFLRETSTFGVRARAVTRYAAAREARTVDTPYGPVRVKLKLLDGVVAGASPEYEDCRRLAMERSISLPRVYAAAIAAASDTGDVTAVSDVTKSS